MSVSSLLPILMVQTFFSRDYYSTIMVRYSGVIVEIHLSEATSEADSLYHYQDGQDLFIFFFPRSSDLFHKQPIDG